MYFPTPKKKIDKETNKASVFLYWVYDRIKKNKNAVIIFNGDTGSGKTYACVDLALELSKMFKTSFTVKNNISYTFIQLLKQIQAYENVPGMVFIMEEIGAMGSGGSSREWQSQGNKAFFTYMQTSRCKNQVIILNAPSFSYLEKGARELVHFQFEAMGINHRNSQSYFKPFKIQCNRRTGKLYFKYLRFIDNGIKRKMKVMKFKLPPADIRKEYEAIKDKFVDDMMDTIKKKSEETTETTKKKYADKSTMLVSMYKQGISIAKIVQYTSLPDSTVYDVLQRELGRNFKEITIKSSPPATQST